MKAPGEVRLADRPDTGRSSLDTTALIIAIGASIAVFRFRAPTLAVLAVSAAVGGATGAWGVGQ